MPSSPLKHAEREQHRRQKYPQRIKDSQRRTYLKHREKILIRVKAYQDTHKLQSRARYLKIRYNLTIEGWEKLFNEQNRSCKICKTRTSTGKGWHVDHNHVTGAIRGILCHHCNTALGLLKDSLEIAEEVVQYLKGQE